MNDIPWSKLTGPEVFTLLKAADMLYRQQQQPGFLFGIVREVKRDRSWQVISYFGTAPTAEEKRGWAEARKNNTPT